ncbi:MAG: choice-of-anchor D domain-containing protein, partial [Betaproteobacteria bacterium]
LRSKGGVNLQINALTVSGPGASDFTIGGGCAAGLQLQSATIAQSGGSCTITVNYHPLAIGSASASIKLFYGGFSTFPSTQTIVLSGAASAELPAIAIDPTFIDFGEVIRGTSSAARYIAIANAGNVPLQISALSLLGQEADEFSIGGTCVASGLPLLLPTNGSCTVAIQLTAQGLNLRTAQLKIQHNAPPGNSLIALNGTAVAATCPPPVPPTEFQTLACPAAQAGSITQSRAAMCAGTTWLPGPWTTIATNCTATSPAATQPLAEYFNANLNHYFITADAAESREVETGGAGPGWSAALAVAKVWDVAPDVNLAPVCRFYGNPALGSNGQRLGPNSHFYTAEPDECAHVKEDPGWIFEGVVFQAVRPVRGSCPAPWLPLYRSYNGRFNENDSNHRYTTSPAVVAQMTAQGWIAEGVVLCVAAAN